MVTHTERATLKFLLTNVDLYFIVSVINKRYVY